MHEEIVWLGQAPAEEDCAQVGHPDYARDARAECRAYIAAIREVCGKEPEGARLVVRGQEHDYGRYYEVACVYDGNDPAAAAYAALVDERAPRTWAEAGITPPSRGRGL